MPVAPRSAVLWPALSLKATPVDAALLTPQPATAWPRLLDIDEITGPTSDASGNVPEDACCWPPLETAFVERWIVVVNRVPITGGLK